MNGPALVARGIGIDVGGRTILDGVDLVAEHSSLLVLTGASGSGKSLLAEVLAGLRVPERGAVTLDGSALNAPGANAARLAFVPQDFGLVASLTAAESVALPLLVRGIERTEQRARTDRWLDALGIASCASRTVNELSGGQRQRVAIARALAMETGTIVMDEPTAELDPANRELVGDLVRAACDSGAAVVIFSHDADVIAAADRVAALSGEGIVPLRP